MLSNFIKTNKNRIIQRHHYATIGIRREDKSRWERRAPLTPDHVKLLIKDTGTKIYIQPSTKRIFPIETYERAGAIVTEDLSPADIILGIKEVPESSLLPEKTYIFFSHTHKGNEKNMPMLQNILDKNIRLMDYELMTDEKGKRLVAFGKFAGNAGMIDTLHGMGHRFLGMGYSTPLMYMSMAHTYPTLAQAKLALHGVGNMIMQNGTPKDFGPLIYAFTGYGNVAQGALEIFRELPHEFVPAQDLEKIVNDKNPNLKKLYATQLGVEDYIVTKDGNRPLESTLDYITHPEKYHSNFHQKIAPYTNCVITGAYWDKRYPRTMSNEQLQEIEQLKKKGVIKPGKMMSLGDIVCDIRGAFECLSHSTPVDDGFFYYDALRGQEHKNVEGDGIQVMGVDILPAELPIESSQYFSKRLYPHIEQMATQPANVPLDQLPSLLRHCTITDRGKLTKAHQDLQVLLPSSKFTTTATATATTKKTVLLLGSGMVAAPLVDHLAKRPDVNIVVASNMTKEAKALVSSYSNAESVPLDIADHQNLSNLVGKADVVVSFVPAFLHTKVANVCIEQRKDMVTASYVSKEMQNLNERAQKAGILIMNEVGLDPGIDHMSAMKIIDEAKRNGSKIRSFISWCGGLPAPEASHVPFGYKFSWSPRGVLTASGNDAIYWNNGKKHTISGDNLLKEHFPVVRTPFAGFVFEGLANRNSLGYSDIYGLGPLSEMDTMFRGTLRYQGYSDLLYAFRQLGFLEANEPLQNCTNWPSYFEKILSDVSKDSITKKLGLSDSHPMAEKVWFTVNYLLSGEIDFPSHLKGTSALDHFSQLLAKQLKYDSGERDMVGMHHEFGVEHRSGKKETLTSTLIKYGNDQHTAMAETVGLPAAMTVDLILDNKIPERGVQVPTQPHVYLPILEQLEMNGIQFIERVEPYRLNQLLPIGSGLYQ